MWPLNQVEMKLDINLCDLWLVISKHVATVNFLYKLLNLLLRTFWGRLNVIFFERENPAGKSVLEVLRKLTAFVFRSFLWFSIQSVHVWNIFVSYVNESQICKIQPKHFEARK